MKVKALCDNFICLFFINSIAVRLFTFFCFKGFLWVFTIWFHIKLWFLRFKWVFWGVSIFQTRS